MGILEYALESTTCAQREMCTGSYSREKDGLMVVQNLISRGRETTINPLTFRTTLTCYTEIVLKTTH